MIISKVVNILKLIFHMYLICSCYLCCSVTSWCHIVLKLNLRWVEKYRKSQLSTEMGWLISNIGAFNLHTIPESFAIWFGISLVYLLLVHILLMRNNAPTIEHWGGGVLGCLLLRNDAADWPVVLPSRTRPNVLLSCSRSLKHNQGSCNVIL